jgi:N-acetylglutamate synthase-like GNAT family acetyltransferase
MVNLTFRPFENEDLPFFQDLISSSSKWRKNELRDLSLEEYLEEYEGFSGQWRIWEKAGSSVAMSYHLESALSNQKPWLGTILVKSEERRRGVASEILNQLSEECKVNGNRAIFAAVPIDEYEWANFLTDCGFEQFKTEENKGETFLIMVRPRE